MRYSPKIEEDLGIEVYATSSDGIGGEIRQKYEDFLVKEIPMSAEQSQNESRNDMKADYSVFWLEKRGLETISAIKRIARELQVSQRRFSFAGMKDRNAVTLQRVSAWKVPPEKLKEVDLRGIRITGVSKSNNPIVLGSHWGNDFTIMVRGIPLTAGTAEYRIKRISNEIKAAGGIPDFFGHQRFGLVRPITHIVGLKILRGEFKEAAMAFLSNTSPYETDEIRAARAELGTTEDFKSAMKNFPSKLTYELCMLRKLSSSPNNFANAFRVLPRRLLQMFVSAAQGWLYNKFVSKRLKENVPLNRCLQGDLVSPLRADELVTKELVKVDLSNIDEMNRNLEYGKATVVYPVPGYDMALPIGLMRDIVKEVMTKEDLIPRSFWISRMPEISSAGVFRQIAVTPKNPNVSPVISNSIYISNATFAFSLVRGSYGTIVLREFMKNDDPIAAGY